MGETRNNNYVGGVVGVNTPPRHTITIGKKGINIERDSSGTVDVTASRHSNDLSSALEEVKDAVGAKGSAIIKGADSVYSIDTDFIVDVDSFNIISDGGYVEVENSNFSKIILQSDKNVIQNITFDVVTGIRLGTLNVDTGSTVTINSDSPGPDVNDLLVSGGNWFACGGIGSGSPYIAQSNNGLTGWANETIPGATTGIIRAMAVGESSGDVVAVGDGEFLYYDGVSWTRNADGSDYYAVAKGEDDTGTIRWVAVGDSGIIKYSDSPSGFVWTTANSQPSSPNLRSVHWADGIWVAGGGSGSYWWSLDGSNWNAAAIDSNLSTSTAVYGITKGNGVWVAATGSEGEIAYTTDPTSEWIQAINTVRQWRFVRFIPASDLEDFSGVSDTDDGLFVAGGFQSNAEFWTSKDGINWTFEHESTLGSISNSMAFNNGTMVLGLDAGNAVAANPIGVIDTQLVNCNFENSQDVSRVIEKGTVISGGYTKATQSEL